MPRTGLADLLRTGSPEQAERLYRDVAEAGAADHQGCTGRGRASALTVAVEDLEEAVSIHPEIAQFPRTAAIRDCCAWS